MKKTSGLRTRTGARPETSGGALVEFTYRGMMSAAKDDAARGVARGVLGDRAELRAHGSGYEFARDTRDNTWDIADRATAERLAQALREACKGRVRVRAL